MSLADTMTAQRIAELEAEIGQLRSDVVLWKRMHVEAIAGHRVALNALSEAVARAAKAEAEIERLEAVLERLEYGEEE